MKTHDWYCQGLSASWLSHRRTVEAEMGGQIPSVMIWRASSGADHRANGRPLSVAGRHANALTCATCTGVNLGGRPDRFPSLNADRPGDARHRCRHLAAVSTQIARLSAIAVVGHPCAASSTIMARSASRCGVGPGSRQPG